jgi:hypothetical protein
MEFLILNIILNRVDPYKSFNYDDMCNMVIKPNFNW